ncbi:MAG: hypothetical protein KAV87_60945 [Desulfobacteraceae bacterium]|nr:hypothetical protein [Desulfobacteraceae bacterium]
MTGFYYFVSSVIAGLTSNAITIYFQKAKRLDIGIIVLCCYFALMVVLAIFAFRHHRKLDSTIKRIDEMDAIGRLRGFISSLCRYVSHPEQLRAIDKDGTELIGGYAANFTWKEVASHICKVLELGNLRYSTLGSRYSFVDLENMESFEIPTDNRLEAKLTESGLKNGQILLLEKKPPDKSSAEAKPRR